MVTAMNYNITGALDTEIAKLEQRIKEIENVAQQLPAAKAELEAFRKVRARMAGEVESPRLSANGTANAESNGNKPSRVVPGSIGALAIEILREAGKPVQIKELLAKVRERGKPNVSEGTLVSTLCWYLKGGKVTRPLPSMYAAP
jgi:hypothetical protein